MPHVTAVEAASVLGWLVAAGVDTAVGDAPHNWLAAPMPRQAAAPFQRSAVAPAIREPSHAIAAPGSTIAARAGDVAAAAPDLVALTAALAAFDHPLREATPPQLVTGDIASGIVILGDQPLATDSPEARLAMRMLAAIDLHDGNSARLHLLPWTTNRPARDADIAVFAPFRDRALALVAPRLILAFGDKAAALSGEIRSVAALRGKWLAIAGVPTLATFPPSRLLAQPDLKRLGWADLQAFAAAMKAH